MMLTRQSKSRLSRVPVLAGGFCMALSGVMVLGVSPAAAQSATEDYSRIVSARTSSSVPPIVVPGGTGTGSGERLPGLYVEVRDGMINASNPDGPQQFGSGQFGFTPPSMPPAPPPIVLPQNPGLAFTPPPFFRQPPGPVESPPPVVTPVIPVVPNPPPVTLPVVLQSGPGYYLMNWGSDGLASLGAGTATFNAQNGLTKVTGTTMPFVVNSAVTIADAGSLNDLGWGRWTAGTVTDHGMPIDLSTWKAGMPYLVGKPTTDANLPISGTMTYALAGATKAIDMTTGAVGTLSGSLSIAFQNAQYSVTPNLSIAMPGQTYVTGAGTTTVGPGGARATFSTLTQNVTGGACAGGACTLSTQGVLTGAAANNAGIVYALTGPDVKVNGAAGFKR